MRCPGCKNELSGVVIHHTVKRDAIVNSKGFVLDVMPIDDLELEGEVSQDIISRVECEGCCHDVTKLVKMEC